MTALTLRDMIGLHKLRREIAAGARNEHETRDDQLEASWLALWRLEASRGIEPFPAVRLCPCGYAEDCCPCIRREQESQALEAS